MIFVIVTFSVKWTVCLPFHSNKDFGQFEPFDQVTGKTIVGNFTLEYGALEMRQSKVIFGRIKCIHSAIFRF